jgi:hypothetical protein
MGTLDIPSVFHFIGHVMKKNCAPKRDSLVETMIGSECAIEGLRSVLKLIELMKLDLANYKLDQLRPLIAKTAISTERSFFSQLLNSGKISLDLTRKWLASAGPSQAGVHASASERNGSKECSGAYEAFVDGGIRLLVSPFVRETNQVPETFILDKKRLISLHGRFQDLCIVQCLLLIFKQASRDESWNASRKLFSGNLLKRELLRLLDQPNTQISDISSLITKSLKECREAPSAGEAGAELGDFAGADAGGGEDFGFIHGALNKIIAPDNELFVLIEGKLVERVRARLRGDGDESALQGFSRLNVLEELEELIKKFGTLLQYNWNVFEPLYATLTPAADPRN